MQLNQLANADDDMLQFRDSVRDSVVSYFNKHNKNPTAVIDEFAPLDTPTRILNNSNEFLPITYTESLTQLSQTMSVSVSQQPSTHNKKNAEKQNTPRQEMRKQKERLQELIQKMPIN